MSINPVSRENPDPQINTTTPATIPNGKKNIPLHRTWGWVKWIEKRTDETRDAMHRHHGYFREPKGVQLIERHHGYFRQTGVFKGVEKATDVAVEYTSRLSSFYKPFLPDTYFKSAARFIIKLSSMKPIIVGNTLTIALITSVFFQATQLLTTALLFIKIIHMVVQVFNRVTHSMQSEIDSLQNTREEPTKNLKTQVALFSQRVEELEHEVSRLANTNTSLSDQNTRDAH